MSPGDWIPVKRDLEMLLGLDRDALHIYIGVAAYLLTARVLRLRLCDWRALLPLAVCELLNEAIDLIYEPWPPIDRAMQYWASLHDIFNTLALPVLIVLIVRRVRPD